MDLKITQLNKENTGINSEGITEGYRHGDGLHFSGEISDLLDSNFKILAKDILLNFPTAKYILDIGSGAGHLRRWLLEENRELIVVTLDGNKDTINSPFIDKDFHFVVRTDRDYELVDNNIVKFDLVCSFEHFEHISEDYFHISMNNILKHSKSGTIIFASAANYKYFNEDERHIHCNVKSKGDWHNYLSGGYELESVNKTILNQYNWGSRMGSCSELIYLVK